jgi:hypothetical protein
MSERVALKVAIDLIHVPSQVRVLRKQPLPDGVLTLLLIAGGDRESERDAAALADRPPDVIRKAAMFFIEQILFAPGADSYRVLGAEPQASASDLRRNVGLLLRWLHPDLDPRGERSVFVGRVTTAWNDLKTPERRAAYDALLQRSKSKSKFRSRNGKSRPGRQTSSGTFSNGGSQRHRFGARPAAMRAPQRPGLIRRALSALFHRPL